MPFLSLAFRYWYVGIILGLVVALGISRLDIRHLHTVNGVLQARITSLEAINTLNVQKAIHDKEAADAAYASSSKAAALLGASLDSRVRDYENRLRAGALQSPAEPPGSPGEPTPAPSLGELVGPVLAACARDAARLQSAHDWAEGLGHDGPPDPRP